MANIYVVQHDIIKRFSFLFINIARITRPHDVKRYDYSNKILQPRNAKT